MALRYDIADFRKPERTPQGFLRADAVLTRSGVLLYRNPDGSTRREYRPPDEVFREDSLKTFEDAPLTMLHPSRLVDAGNVTEVSIGSVKEAPRRKGNLAVARVVVTDADAIAQIESRKLSAVSIGYTCEYDPTPGTTPEGERYDGVQRNIVGNHLAIVPAGRAGPEAHIRLDADDAVQVVDPPRDTPATRQGELFAMNQKTIRIDGVDFEVPEQAAQAFEREMEKLRADGTAKAAELSRVKGRADQLEDELKKEREARADAESPEKLAAAVKARVELLRVAQQFLGAERLDELETMGELDIKKAVILSVAPEAKLDDKDATYIGGRFDQATEQAAPTRLDDVRVAAFVAGGSGVDVVTQARMDAAKREAEAWRQPLSASKDRN